MNNCQLLVHFQGKQDWCACVKTVNFDSIKVGEISSVALSRYNSVFRSSYQIEQCSIGIIENYEANIKKIDDPIKEEIKNTNQEIVVILPEQAPKEEHQLSMNDYIHFNRQAIAFLQNYHFSAAHECLILVKKIVCSPKDQILMHLKPLKGLTERGFEIASPESREQNFIKTEYPFKFSMPITSMQEHVQLCCCPTTPKSVIKEHLLEIMKADPSTAIDIVLRNPKLYSFLPKMCISSQHVSFLVKKLKTFDIKPSNFNEFIEMFIMKASLSQILHFFFEIKDTFGFGEPSSVGRYYARFLLFNRDFTKLHEVLMKYFKGNHPFGVCSINLNIFYVFLEKLKRNPTLPPSQILCPPDARITIFDAAPLEVLLLTAVYLFMKGEMDYFNTMRNFLDPILSCPANSQFLSQCFFISLFRACQTASYQITESVRMINSTVLVIGDECGSFCANRNYDGIGSVECHLFEMLPIVNLRNEVKLAIKTAFWNRIREAADRYEVIVVVLGNIDLRTTVANILAREFDVSFTSIFERIIDIYLQVINNIHIMIPKVSIVVHELFDFFIDVRPIIRKFNMLLRSKMPDFVSFVRMPEIQIKNIDLKNCPPKEYYNNFREAVLKAKNSVKKKS